MLDRLKAREPEAQKQLSRELFPRVLKLCRRELRGDLAEHVAADVWTDFLFSDVDHVRSQEAIPTYLRMMTVRRCRRMQRWQARHVAEAPAEVHGGEDEAVTLLRDVLATPAASGDASTGWVSLLLLSDEAEMLSLASAAGQLSLVLRPEQSVDGEANAAARTLVDVTAATLEAASTKRRALSANVSVDGPDVGAEVRGVPVRSRLVLLKENDWVDVLALLPDGANGELKGRTLFAQVRVAGVVSLESRHETSALLELLPEEAELLALAKPGQVHLALRNPRETREPLLFAGKTDMRTLLTGERSVVRHQRAQTWQAQEIEIITGRSRAGTPGSSPDHGTERYTSSPLGSYFETRLARRGNGSYHSVDSLFEARRLFVEQLGGTRSTSTPPR